MSNVVPIETRVPLFAEPAGRPGDWWEPLAVSAEVAVGLNREAGLHHLSVDLLAALLVERALVVQDISDCVLDPMRARATLAAAADRQPATGPGHLHTSYVRMLRGGESGYQGERAAQLAQRDLILPLRLHDAVRSVDLAEVCASDSLDEAIAWEISAATSGQFMRGWALRTLLLQTATQSARV